MKKMKRILALLMVLLLLPVETTVRAESTSDTECPTCGKTITVWHQDTEGGAYYHVPYCLDHGILYALMSRCTPVAGTATCSSGELCSVCGYEAGEPDPSLHSYSDWYNYYETRHYRYCMNCGDPDTYDIQEHSGGTVYCNQSAICEVCGQYYGEPDPDAHIMSDWYSYDSETHYRYCTICGDPDISVFGKHDSSDGACVTECTVCGLTYTNPNGTHSYGEWSASSETQHSRSCSCGAIDYADHVGDDTCTSYCEDCGILLTDPNGTHSLTEWRYYDETRHVSCCSACGEADTYVYAPHEGDGTCSSLCTDCGEVFTDPNGTHSMTEWYYGDETQHFSYCSACGEADTYVYASHVGDGTCTSQCEDCGTLLTDPNGTHSLTEWSYYDSTRHYRYCDECNADDTYLYEEHYGGTATCDQSAICVGCGREYGDLDGDVHLNMSDWYSDNNETHYRYCNDCGRPESYVFEEHDSSDGACFTECSVCGEAFTDPNGTHTMTEWRYYDETQHYRYCSECVEADTYVYASHVGDGTCTSQCTVCGADFTDPNGTHSMTKWYYEGETQHYRYCIICGDSDSYEYKEHYGGTASCDQRAICEGCGRAYGDYDESVHLDMSDWYGYNSETHYRICGCGYEEYTNHVGDGTCTSQCTVCGVDFKDPNGTHSMTEWYYGTDTDHVSHCSDCLAEDTYVYAPHEGDGTCASQCTVCGADFKDPNGTHTMTEWYHGNETDHVSHCSDCLAEDTFVYAPHEGDGTCRSKCTVCGAGLTDPNGTHSLAEWSYYDETQHYSFCIICGDSDTYEYEEHSGGTATCTTQAVCEDCGKPYGGVLGHVPGEEATCTTDQVCTRDGCGAVLTEKLGHAPGEEATCTTDQVCTRDGCGAVLTEKLGHDYAAVTPIPTCDKKSYVTYTCTRCKDSYTGEQIGAVGHWYDLWYPNSDGTHSAECRRNGCNHVGTTQCTLLEITVKDGETEVILTVCPVCGDFGDTPFDVILGALIKAVDRNALPRGELIVRGMEAPFDGVLYAFTAAYEYAGKVEPFMGAVSVTVPLDAEDLGEFRLVRVDVSPATEDSERSEVWTDIAFDYNDGELTFETDTAGLFLLIPVQ